tara:strand:+ start:426 stop:1103 length:678 start_codon:yes stop_codon:yes gene_type:complete
MNPIKHVAIIMDGNGRWGIKNKKSRNFGHREGLFTVEKIIKQTVKKKIKYLTLYAFSTENWKRPKKEINFLFHLLEEFFNKKIHNLHNKGVKIKIIGNKKAFSKRIFDILSNSESLTKKNKILQLNLALNYGSKFELINAMNLIVKKKIPITESNLIKNLYTNGTPDPDLLIRTGNTNRLSNFLLWQTAYSEIFFVKKLWPDFTVNDYNKILLKFKKTKRNFGNI